MVVLARFCHHAQRPASSAALPSVPTFPTDTMRFDLPHQPAARTHGNITDGVHAVGVVLRNECSAHLLATSLQTAVNFRLHPATPNAYRSSAAYRGQ